MDLRQIKELMAAMKKTGTKQLKIKQENGYELSIESHEFPMELESYSMEPREEKPFVKQDASFFKGTGGGEKMKSQGHLSDGEGSSESSKSKKGDIVKSPMVGTFYHAASPDDEPFVRIGDLIQPDSVICIIEAMKVMNEIKAGIKGRVMEVLVENGQPVEFGTALYRVEPNA